MCLLRKKAIYMENLLKWGWVMYMLIIVENSGTKIPMSKTQENIFSSIILNESGCTSLVFCWQPSVLFYLLHFQKLSSTNWKSSGNNSMNVSELLCYAYIYQLDRLQFLTTLFLEIQIFWDVTLCWMSSFLCFESL